MTTKIKFNQRWQLLLLISVVFLISCNNYGNEKDKKFRKMSSVAKEKNAMLESVFKEQKYTYNYETMLPCLVCISSDNHIADITMRLSKYATDSINWNCELSSFNKAAWMKLGWGTNQYYIGLTKSQADWLSTHKTKDLLYIVRIECVSYSDLAFFHDFIGEMVEIVGANIEELDEDV